MGDSATVEEQADELKNAPVLVGCSNFTINDKIILSCSEFVVGRSKTSSHNIPNIFVSKIHCIFHHCDGKWTVSDKSKFGTFINNKKVEKGRSAPLKDGDEIRLGKSDIRYKFLSSPLSVSSANKRPKLPNCINFQEEKDKFPGEISLCRNLQKRHQTETAQLNKKLKADTQQQCEKEKEIEQLEAKHVEEMRLCKKQVDKEKQLLEEKVKEMQRKLEEKEREESLLNKKLQEKEEQRLKDLEEQEAKTKVLLESLRAEVATREETLKLQLETEIQKLKNEKEKIEKYIKHELLKSEESAENLKQLREELEKVKGELANMEGKKQFLEKELEHTTNRAQEQLTESSLKAKQEVLQNFSQLVESELQCSICNELFVTATTLNCTHTFCHMCISEWKKKKKDCPNCRTSIKSENRSIALDNFIDRIVENLSKELRNRRQEIIEERQVQELLAAKYEASTSKQQQRQWARSPNSRATTRRNTGENIDIEIGSNSGSSISDSEFDSDYIWWSSSSTSSVEGIADAYYGGYGYCYNCGRRGHWVSGCPYR